MVHDEENPFFLQVFVHKSIHTNPANDNTLEDNTCHRYEKCIYQDQSRNENSFIGKSVREIEESDHDKKTHKDGFYYHKYFLDDPGDFFDSIELLKRKYHSYDTITYHSKTYEVGEVDSSVWELYAGDQISRDTDLTSYEKCSYDYQELKGDSYQSKKEHMTTHKRKYRKIFDFSNLVMVQ